MPDSRFFETAAPISLAEAIRLTGAHLLSGEPGAMLTHVAAPSAVDDESAIIFCESPVALKQLNGAKFGLCLLSDALIDQAPKGGAVATAPAAKLAFAVLAARLHRSRLAGPRQTGFPTAQTAFIADDARLGSEVYIGPQSTIGPGVVVGSGCVIGAGVHISHAVLGEGVRILAGACIGQSGFGYTPGPDGFVRIPQLGRVIIEDNVEIGANTTVDRGALADTVIGAGAKIDNLVQIGHNVRIGRNCMIAGQTGISGSCTIGDGVIMGGQVGLTDHLTIGDGAQIAAGSGLMHDVPPGEVWGGRPARPIKKWLREVATLTKLSNKRNG